MQHKLAKELVSAIAEGLTSQSLTVCSRWAAERRVMGAPFPGRYSWAKHPWVRELHDSQAPYTWCMKGAQLGITEVAINRAFFTLDVLKRDVLYVLPTQLGATDFSKSRFGVALEHSPYLKGMFSDVNAVGLKRAGANTLYIRGSKGRAGLKSVPVSEMILDELDEFDQDKLWLALERLSGQVHKHVWGISTPTVPEFGVHKQYGKSTQEHYFFRCPACRRWTELIWPDCIEICGTNIDDPKIRDSFIKCKECSARLDQRSKPEWLSDGVWRPTNANAAPEVRGFHVNQLYSFTINPAELVTSYFRGFGDELAAQEFHNSKLGQPFIGDGAKVDDEMLTRSIGNYSMQDARPGRGAGRLVTMGCDQGKTAHIVIAEWFKINRCKDVSASHFCRVLWGEECSDQIVWKRLSELMSEWQILYCVLDADPELNLARDFCRKFEGYAAVTRYRELKDSQEVRESEKESGSPMLTIDRTTFLTNSLGRFKANPSRIQLPRDIPAKFKEQMKNLTRTYQRVDKSKANPEGTPTAMYVATGPDHYAHALTYAELALYRAPHSTTKSLGLVL